MKEKIELCNAHTMPYDGDYYCNRPKEHPGKHCRFFMDLTGYHNIWFTVVKKLKKKLDKWN